MSIKTNRPACNANTTFMILITYIPYGQKVGETTNKKELHSKIFCKIEKKKKEKRKELTTLTKAKFLTYLTFYCTNSKPFGIVISHMLFWCTTDSIMVLSHTHGSAQCIWTWAIFLCRTIHHFQLFTNLQK